MSYYDFGGRIITAVAKTASLDFDFSITAAYGGTGDMSVTGMGLEFTIGNTPLGPGIGTTEIYGSFGTAFAGTWSGSNIDLPLLTSGNISGHFHFDVQYDEIKVISPNTNLGGHAYPQSDLSYEAHVKPGYAVNALCTVNGVTTSISQAIAGSGYFLTYETTIQVSAACSRVVNPANPIAGFSYLISTGAATASVTGITYDAGPWTPIPWTSTYPDLPAGSQGFANPVQPQGIIAVSSGSVVCFAPDSPIVVTLPLNPIGFNGNNVGSGASVTVVSAPTQPVAISGVILKGNDPSTDTIPCAYTPNSVNTLPYPVLNAPGGVLNTTLTRYHSRYLTPPPGVQNLTEGTFTFTTSPPVPQDYIQGNLEGLFIGGTYMPDRNLQGDSACYRFDDTSWYVTTFAHAASVVADAFTSNAGWTAINGTLTGSGVGIVVSSLPATLAHPTGYAKDFRN